MSTPFEQGFRMPAEWEPHEATWIGWPHNSTDWPGKLAPIHWVYGEIVRKIAPGEKVRILVNDARQERRAAKVIEKVGVDKSRIQFLRFPTNRGWTRDYGPIFVRRSKPKPAKAIVRFRFNGWARYPDWKKDDAVPPRAALKFRYKLLPVENDLVLEGGGIEVNGRGTLITTEECFLDQKTQVRNPGLSHRDMENVFRGYLGAENVIWLGKGIAGDDTHGHVDDVCRFVGKNTVVLCQEKNPTDENYRPLKDNLERLQGTGLEVVPLPMPAPLFFQSHRLPASYANFYIANEAVLVPTFNDPNDRIALGILADLLTDRPVIGIHAVDLVWGFGTLHCLTQQEPRI